MMKSSNNNILLILATLAVFAPKSEAWAEFQPPKIYPPTPSGYIIYKAGQTATFSCEGTLNGVTWPLPKDASESLKRRFHVKYEVNHQNFVAKLTIRDLNFTDTNNLMCAYNGTTDLRLLKVICRNNLIWFLGSASLSGGASTNNVLILINQNFRKKDNNQVLLDINRHLSTNVLDGAACENESFQSSCLNGVDLLP